MRIYLLLTTIFFSSTLLAAIAPDDFQEVDTSIDHVTVYSDRAKVKRNINISEIKKSWIKIAALPNQIDKTSIRLTSDSAAKKIIEQVIIGDSFYKNSLPADTQEILKKLELLYLTRLESEQKINLLNQHENFLKHFNFNTPYSSSNSNFLVYEASNTLIDSALTEVSNKVLSTHLEKIELENKIKDLNAKIRVLNSSLYETSNKRSQQWLTDIYIKINKSKITKNTKLSLNYLIGNSFWLPEYDIRCQLNSKNGTASINLVTMGKLTNNTGEDWIESALTLSSLDPSPLILPKLNRWVFSEKREEVLEDQGMEEISADFAMAPQANGLMRSKGMRKAKRSSPGKSRKDFARNEAMAAPMPSLAKMGDRMGGAHAMLKEQTHKISSSSLFSTQDIQKIYSEFANKHNYIASNLKESNNFRVFTQFEKQLKKKRYRDNNLPAVQAAGRKIEYDSNFKIELVSNTSPLRIPVNTTKLSGTLEYLLIPKKDKKAYLQTKVKNDSRSLLLGGAANVYLDGDLTSKTNLSTTNENAYITLDLGIDEAIESKRIVKKESKKSGMIFKDHEMEIEVELQVVNNHGFPIDINIKDNYPKSPSDKIKIDLKDISPKPLSKKYGVIHWKAKIGANKKETFKFKYLVKHPENTIIQGYDL